MAGHIYQAFMCVRDMTAGLYGMCVWYLSLQCRPCWFCSLSPQQQQGELCAAWYTETCTKCWSPLYSSFSELFVVYVCFSLFVVFSLRVCVRDWGRLSVLSVIKCSKSNAWQLALFALCLTVCVCVCERERERERADKFIMVCCGFPKQICMFYPQHSSVFNVIYSRSSCTHLFQCVSLPQHSCSFMWFTYYISSSCTGLFPCVSVPEHSCGLTCFYVLQLKQLYMFVLVCVCSTVQLQFNMFYVLHITAQAAVQVCSGVSQAAVQVCSGVCLSHSAVPV